VVSPHKEIPPPLVAGEQKGNENMNDRVMNTQELIPISHLSLDLGEPSADGRRCLPSVESR